MTKQKKSKEKPKGYLRTKVINAFKKYKAGDFEAFVKDLVDVGDVHYQWHRDSCHYSNHSSIP